jgi:Ferritin-like domain
MTETHTSDHESPMSAAEQLAAKRRAASFGDEEAEHVSAVTTAITAGGGTPVKKPTFSFPVTNQAGFRKLTKAGPLIKK